MNQPIHLKRMLLNVILISVFVFHCVNVQARTAWYDVYDNPAKLNDSDFWKKELGQLMEQFKSNLSESGYQSDRGNIMRGFSKIKNPEVIEQVWSFYKTNTDPAFNEAAFQAILSMAEKNPSAQQMLLNEFRTHLVDPLVKYRVAFSTLHWKEPPLETTKFIFQSLNELPLDERLKKMSDLKHYLVRADKGSPVKHLDVYNEEVKKLLLTAPSDDEVKAFTKISAQLAKWSDTPYINLLELYSKGKLDEKRFLPIFNTLSYEINGTIGATLGDLPSTSIDRLFEIARQARLNESPAVRAAVAEFVIRQSWGKHLPADLKAWVDPEFVKDTEAFTKTLDFYKSMSKESKKTIQERFPGVFEKTGGSFSFKACFGKIFNP